VNEGFKLVFHDAAAGDSARNKKKAPIGALLVLAAIIFLLSSYLLQLPGLDPLTVRCLIFATEAMNQ
jgi:hypothetical protein